MMASFMSHFRPALKLAFQPRSFRLRFSQARKLSSPSLAATLKADICASNCGKSSLALIVTPGAL